MKNRRNVSNKTVAILLALVLAIGCAVGGTLAWLISKTEPVVNTFTYGDINIGLTETTGSNYKITPGVDIKKDPKVTVTAGSEDCWLFVKVEKKDWNNNVTYEIADGWTALENQTDVYYRTVDAADNVREFPVLKGNKVTVSKELTKEKIESITNKPTLTFTAYAVQKDVQQDGINTADKAWEQINNSTTTNP